MAKKYLRQTKMSKKTGKICKNRKNKQNTSQIHKNGTKSDNSAKHKKICEYE